MQINSIGQSDPGFQFYGQGTSDQKRHYFAFRHEIEGNLTRYQSKFRFRMTVISDLTTMLD
jgi:hypothetical protein